MNGFKTTYTLLLAGAALAFSATAASADLLVCVSAGIAGPSDPLECENSDKVKSKNNTLSALYKDGWRLIAVTTTSKFDGVSTAYFLDKD